MSIDREENIVCELCTWLTSIIALPSTSLSPSDGRRKDWDVIAEKVGMTAIQCKSRWQKTSTANVSGKNTTMKDATMKDTTMKDTTMEDTTMEDDMEEHATEQEQEEYDYAAWALYS